MQLQNAWAADYDDNHYKDPSLFLPERFLDNPEGAGPLHYGYGAGSRMCIGWQLANREPYTFFLRLICAYEILPAHDVNNAPILNAMECNSVRTSLSMQPKDFKVRFRPRNEAKLSEWIRKSEERTNDL